MALVGFLPPSSSNTRGALARTTKGALTKSFKKSDIVSTEKKSGAIIKSFKKSDIVSTEKKSGAIIKSFKKSDIIPTEKKSNALVKTKGKKDDTEEQIIRVKVKVIKIRDIFKDRYAYDKTKDKKETKDSGREEKKKKEKELEKKSKKLNVGKLGAVLPQTGFFDAITNFLLYTFLGYLNNRFEILPKLIGLIPLFAKAMNFIIDIGGMLLNALVTFVDFGYGLVDKTKEFIKSIGGEGAAKVFDKFLGTLNTLFNLALIAAMINAGGGFGGPRPPRGRGGAGQVGIRGARGAVGRSRFGTSAAAARKYAEKFGVDAAKKKFGEQAVKSLGGKYARSGFTNLARKGAVAVLGKSGVKAAIKVIRPLTKAIPVIGGLLEFGLALMEGDSPGRAGFRAVGSVLFGAIGAALGGPFALFTGGLGAYLGGEAAGKLYDFMFSGKKEPSKPKKKVQGKAGGGRVKTPSYVLGGLLGKAGAGLPGIGGMVKLPSIPKLSIPSIVPNVIGNAIGGIKKLFGLFGTSNEEQTQDKSEPLRDLANKFRDVPLIGGAMYAAMQIALGMKVDRNVLRVIGAQFTAFSNLDAFKGISSSIAKLSSALKFAAGGQVDSTVVSLTPSDNMRSINSLASYLDSEIGSLELLIEEEKKKEEGDLNIDPVTGLEYGPLPLDMTQKQAFATIYELAKKNGASMPELVAGMSMHESGYLRSDLARLYNNPFGQTGSGTKGSVKIVGKDGKERTFAVYNSLDDAIKFHVQNWNNDSKHGKGLGTYGSPLEGLRAGLPTYAPTSDGNNHANYIRSVSSILTTMGFNPNAKNVKADLSTAALVQQRRPVAPGGGGDLKTAGGAVAASELYKEIGANLEQWDIYRNSVALIESNGRYGIFGGSGKHYDGRYQMGEDAKKDGSKVAGVPYPGHSSDPNAHVRVSYRNNPQLQEIIFTGFTIANHRYLMRNPKYKSASVERKLEILGYAHNQGMGGAEKWMTTGTVGVDGFGTKGTKYTDLIAKNFRSKKSGNQMELAQGAIGVPAKPTGQPNILQQLGSGVANFFGMGGTRGTSYTDAGQSQSTPTAGAMGSGHGSAGVKIAGDLGDFMKSKRGQIGVTGSIHQHPRHPPLDSRSYASYHTLGRALDIGGYSPSSANDPRSRERGARGQDEQAPVIRALLKWNQQNNYKPVQLIHGSPAFRNLGSYREYPDIHHHHVHVAYQGGGMIGDKKSDRPDPILEKRPKVPKALGAGLTGKEITPKSGTKVKGAGVDTQLIVAQPGEVVINKPTVDTLGSEFFLALNRKYGESNANKIKPVKVYKAQGGGSIGKNIKTYNGVDQSASYEQSSGTLLAIQPVMIPQPMPMGGGSGGGMDRITFAGSGSVNSYNPTKMRG